MLITSVRLFLGPQTTSVRLDSSTHIQKPECHPRVSIPPLGSVRQEALLNLFPGISGIPMLLSRPHCSLLPSPILAVRTSVRVSLFL